MKECLDFIKNKGLQNEFKEFMRDKKEPIIWKDWKCDIKTQWWLKVGKINNEERFHLFCNKEIKVILLDLKTNEEHLIKEGTFVAGFKKAGLLR